MVFIIQFLPVHHGKYRYVARVDIYHSSGAENFLNNFHISNFLDK